MANKRCRKAYHHIFCRARISFVCDAVSGEQGFEITYLPVNHDGVISVEELKNAVREDTILVSLMHVNNEIGAVMPIEEAGAAIKEKNPAALFHVDAIQSTASLKSDQSA
jgi:cysteine sulfinate desulfinase/cysteine desulfurase-like protein